MSDIHSCSYYCTRPACVLAQRDEMRDKLMKQAEPVVEPAEPVAWHFQSFEDWWDNHGFHNAFEAGQIDGKPLAKLAWEVAREIAPQQKQAEPAEPVVDERNINRGVKN